MPKNGKYKKSEMTKKRIVRASLAIRTRKGHGNTTIRDICKEANISVGTFYKYFHTKNDIYIAIYEPADHYFTNTVAKKIRGDTATEKVVDFFRYYAKMNINTGIENTKILYNPENSWLVQRRPLHQVLENIIKDGQDSAELSDDIEAIEIVDFLFIFMRGCCHNWCMMNGTYDLEAQMVEYAKRLMLALQKSCDAGNKKKGA